MKVHNANKPCAPFVSTLQKLVFENSKGGLFKWYVRKHAEKCGGCRATLEALKCYKHAVREAYEQARQEGESLMTPRELNELLDKLEVSPQP